MNTSSWSRSSKDRKIFLPPKWNRAKNKIRECFDSLCNILTSTEETPLGAWTLFTIENDFCAFVVWVLPGRCHLKIKVGRLCFGDFESIFFFFFLFLSTTKWNILFKNCLNKIFWHFQNVPLFPLAKTRCYIRSKLTDPFNSSKMLWVCWSAY